MGRARIGKILVLIVAIFLFKLAIGDRFLKNKDPSRSPAQSIIFKR